MTRPRSALLGSILLLASACGSGAEKTAERPPATRSTAKAEAEGAPEPAPAPDLPAAEDLFAAHVEAVGGREAMAKFETLYFESSVDTGAQNIKAKARTWWKQGRFYGEQEIPGFGMARSGYDGDVVWVDDPINGLRKLDGKEAEQIIREGAIFLVADWKQHFTRAETVGRQDVDGRTLYDVELTTPLGDQLTMSFAADDKLLTRMRFEQITPTGTVPVTAMFDDYRPIEGVQFAHTSTLEIALGKVTQTYDAIEVNADVDPGRFAYPAAGAVPADPSPESSKATPPG
jgi:hypothetical protein